MSEYLLCPAVIFGCKNFVPVLSQAPGVKIDPVKFDEVIHSEKRKDLLDIKTLKFHFQIIPLKICNDEFVLTKHVIGT